MWMASALVLLIFLSFGLEGIASECAKNCIRVVRAKVGGMVILNGTAGRDWMRERFFGLEEGMGTRCGRRGDDCLEFEFIFVKDNTVAVPLGASQRACHDGGLVIGPLTVLDSGYYYQPNYFWDIPKSWTKVGHL
ncbi:unnamed protein product [Strongylus vulgaris]|uniref:Uncharacterized protein n=1 Tax=Strongylus vulgaris TaxID=40348 RepID=A0A3P7L8T8_STRVU|nr:unnamed protein product [Strongylus vulgaris]